MITIQKIGKLFMMFLIVAGFASCNDDNDTEPFDAIGEVVTIKKMDMEADTVVYARAYFVYANQPMSSAKVSLPEGGTITLTDTDANKRTYFSEPDSADYSTDAPEAGNFTFTVVNEDIESTYAETTELKTFEIPEITEVTPTVGSGIIAVKWNKVTNADSYVVRLQDDEGETVFVGTLLSSSVDNFQIAASTGTFTKQLITGDTYTVDLRAILYEDTATNSDYLYNIEMVSVASQDFIWE